MPRDLGIDTKLSRHTTERFTDFLQDFGRDRGRFKLLRLIRGTRRAQAGPMPFQPIRLVRAIGLGRFKSFLKPCIEGIQHGLGRFRRHRSFLRQPFRIKITRRAQFANAVIHLRLGEGGLVALIMAMAAIADDIQHHIRAKHHAEFGCQACAEHHRFRIIAIHMQDWRLDGFRHIGAVQAGIGMRRNGGEADLVIRDDMQRAAGAIANQLAHRQRFIDHALPRKGSIAMQQNAHHGTPALDIARHILPRAYLARHHRVHRFQMRRIGLQ